MPSDWRHQLEDPDAPLFTLAVVADLLGVDVQVVRRFDADGVIQTARPSGNQRRYSRNDIALLARAIGLLHDGMTRRAIARILELEHRLEQATGDRRGRSGPFS